ncbi:MAG: VWA domain-containing protein [Candidatus Hydrogenedentes bacterium]|nr:VWA domain-containing protein [Candidatus Hydrogenedentota bacterium]
MNAYSRFGNALGLGLVVCAALGAGADAAAQQIPEVMFILDASGSMMGDAGGMAKIDAAKQAIAAIVPAIAPEVPIGLTLYGHRRKSDCGDIEIALPAGSTDRDTLLAKVAGIAPVGMTPIADSIRMVADQIKAKEVDTVIILVSDGKETCVRNPHGVVRRLKTSGIKFILHVIGFGVTAEERVELMSLAKAGGGEYFAAADLDSLLAALQDVNKQIAAKVEQAKTTAVSAGTKLGKLRIAMPEPATISIASIKIVRHSDGTLIKTVEDPPADANHPLPAGDYEVIMGFANPNYQDPTEVSYGVYQVVGGETTSLTLGAVLLNLAEPLGEAVDAVSVVEAGADTPLVTIANTSHNDYYLFKPKPVPEGIYDLVFQYYRSPKPTVVATDIEVKEEQAAVATLDSGFVLKRPADQGVNGWDLLPAGEKEPVLVVRRGHDNDEPVWRHFLVPPGKYDLNVLLPGMEEALLIGEGIQVEKGQTVVFDLGL